ncbi:interleukin-18 [Trichechus inunguis]|uniref:Interleukin-18 n=1 Tax=Trichechus manatus latirostris TaxID=127582 RepID=A0A2Y9RMJ7_TRIMA|nr:interleukin-18 [Trichechus manatus latirostris]XP_023592753.1 interleukin-18 [Trichechus manatus latirostris]
MAAEPIEDSCINFVEMKFIDNTLYFISENDGSLEADHFGKLESTKLAIIRNLSNQVLFIDRKHKPVFEDMPDTDYKDNAPEAIFIITVYKDSQPRHLAVTISVKCRKRISTLSCENKTINFKEITPPEDINDTQSDIIFFMKNVEGHDEKTQFESSSYPGYFLASEKDADLYRLILKEKNQIGDNSVMFTVDLQELGVKYS